MIRSASLLTAALAAPLLIPAAAVGQDGDDGDGPPVPVKAEACPRTICFTAADDPSGGGGAPQEECYCQTGQKNGQGECEWGSETPTEPGPCAGEIQFYRPREMSEAEKQRARGDAAKPVELPALKKFSDLSDLRVDRGATSKTDPSYEVTPTNFNDPRLYQTEGADGNVVYLALFDYRVTTAGADPEGAGMLRIGFEVTADFRNRANDPKRFKTLPATVKDEQGGNLDAVENVQDRGQFAYRVRIEGDTKGGSPLQYAVRTNSVL